MADFTMPALGADMETGKVVQWLVAPGTRVKPGQVVAVVETHKGAIDVECFLDGVIDDLAPLTPRCRWARCWPMCGRPARRRRRRRPRQPSSPHHRGVRRRRRGWPKRRRGLPERQRRGPKRRRAPASARPRAAVRPNWAWPPTP